MLPNDRKLESSSTASVFHELSPIEQTVVASDFEFLALLLATHQESFVGILDDHGAGVSVDLADTKLRLQRYQQVIFASVVPAVSEG